MDPAVVAITDVNYTLNSFCAMLSVVILHVFILL